MNRKKLVIAVIVLFLGVFIWIVSQGMRSKGKSLINPGVGKAVESVVSQSTPVPQVSAYNAPKEIKYDSTTDLKKELDSIDPKVLDSDF